MSDHVVSGRVWRFGTDVDTDVIVPSQYMRKEPEEYAEHVMEPEDPEFAANLSPGDVIVAEENFGIGSSREHAAIGLKRAGVGAILAQSFGRIFYRNAINQGLPVLRVDASIVEELEDGDEIQVDVFDGTITTSAGVSLTAEPPAGLIRDILAAGGARHYYGAQR